MYIVRLLVDGIIGAQEDEVHTNETLLTSLWTLERDRFLTS